MSFEEVSTIKIIYQNTKIIITLILHGDKYMQFKLPPEKEKFLYVHKLREFTPTATETTISMKLISFSAFKFYQIEEMPPKIKKITDLNACKLALICNETWEKTL